MFQCKRVSLRRSGVVAAILAMAIAGIARAAEPDVLKQIPGDAYGVIVLNNVRALGTKIANAGTRLDLPVPPDPIGYLTRSIGIEEGFDPNGSAALVMLKPAPENASQPYFAADVPPAVLLLPTTNAKLMLEPFKPTAADKDGISIVTMPDNPDQKGFVAVVAGKWVAISPKKEDLASYIARGDAFNKTVSPGTLKVFETNDFVFWANIPKLSAGADKLLDDVRSTAAGELELRTQVTKQDALEGAGLKLMIDGFVDFAKEFLADTNSGMFTIRLTESGATLGVSGDFKANSPFGKFVASQDSQTAPSLDGLPSGNFLVAGSMRFNGETLQNPLRAILDKLSADPSLSKDERLPEIKKAFNMILQELSIVKGTSYVFLDPAAGGKNGLLNGAILVDTSDPQKLLDLQLESSKGLLANQTMDPDLKQTVTVTPNAVNIKGVQLTRMTVKIALRDETPEKPVRAESKVAIEAVNRIYGPDGMTVYSGIVGKKFLMIYGSDNTTLESSVAAAQSNSSDLSKMPEIVAMKDQIVTNPVGVAYMPIARWVGLVPMIAGMGQPAAGAPLPPAAKPVPPMVMSVGVVGNTMTAEMHLPISTIMGVQEAIKQMEAQMQGGGAPVPNLP